MPGPSPSRRCDRPPAARSGPTIMPPPAPRGALRACSPRCLQGDRRSSGRKVWARPHRGPEPGPQPGHPPGSSSRSRRPALLPRSGPDWPASSWRTCPPARPAARLEEKADRRGPGVRPGPSGPGPWRRHRDRRHHRHAIASPPVTAPRPSRCPPGNRKAWRLSLRVHHAIRMAAITIRHVACGDLRKVATKCVSRCLTEWARTAAGERGSQRVGLRLWRAWVALAVGNGHPSDAVRADCPPGHPLDLARRARLCGQPGYAESHWCTAQFGKRVPQITVGPLTLGPTFWREKEEGTLTMWVFLSARLRTWLLLAIAVPLVRLLVHRLAVGAERHDPSARTARLLRRADSAVTAVSGRSWRRARH